VARKSFKNMRENWHQQARRNVTKTIRFGANQSRNAFLRNLPGVDAGVHSTRPGPGKGQWLPYENRPKGNYTFNKRRVNNAVAYRKITNAWTPQTRGHTRLGRKSSRVLANVYAAAAPNYNYRTMVNSVWARNNISDSKKGKISDRLYELYGPEEDDSNAFSYNSNSAVIDDEESPRPRLPAAWTTSKVSYN
jgi:hypothetical protein